MKTCTNVTFFGFARVLRKFARVLRKIACVLHLHFRAFFQQHALEALRNTPEVVCGIYSVDTDPNLIRLLVL